MRVLRCESGSGRSICYARNLSPKRATRAHDRTNTKRLDRSTHIHFYQRLLGSGARIADGDKADW